MAGKSKDTMRVAALPACDGEDRAAAAAGGMVLMLMKTTAMAVVHILTILVPVEVTSLLVLSLLLLRLL